MQFPSVAVRVVCVDIHTAEALRTETRNVKQYVFPDWPVVVHVPGRHTQHCKALNIETNSHWRPSPQIAR